MAHAHDGDDKRRLLDWDKLQIGERLPTLSYMLTQEMIDEYRKGVMDPEAAYPTISHKVDVRAYHEVYRDNGSVNARCAFHCFNPAIPGKKITVQAWIADKYARRGKTYIVTEAVSVDEDGRLLDRVVTHELKQPSEVGKKWQ
jgi:hypothetical protein